jgi:nucleoid-associated protein YgaU
MGNIGGIEKIMVFGILLIIVAILGIAFYSAIKVENDLTPNRLKAAGNEKVVDNFKTEGSDPRREEKKNLSKPVVRDLPTFNHLQANTTVPVEKKEEKQPVIEMEEPEVVIFDDEDESKKEEKEEVVVEPPAPRMITTYKIKKGDSYMGLARRFYGDAQKFITFIDANPDLDPDRLQIGQMIKLPVPISSLTGLPKKSGSKKTIKKRIDGKTYVVQKGDTLAGIAIKFFGSSKDWRKIWDANRSEIANPDMLKVGATLIIP